MNVNTASCFCDWLWLWGTIMVIQIIRLCFFFFIYLVSCEVIRERDVRPGAVLPCRGVRLSLQAFPAWTRQLPAGNFASGSGGQELRLYELILPRPPILTPKFQMLRLICCHAAGYQVVPPFRPTGRSSDLLVLSDSESCKSWIKECTPLCAVQHLDLQTDLDRDHHRWAAGRHDESILDSFLNILDNTPRYCLCWRWASFSQRNCFIVPVLSPIRWHKNGSSIISMLIHNTNLHLYLV